MQENYTKQDIIDAFIKLSENKSFDKITISELAKICGISRQTFYYHFQDVMDVAEAALIRVIEAAEQEAQKCANYRESIKIFVMSVQNHKAIFKNMYDSKLRNQLIHYIILGLNELLKNMIEREENHNLDKRILSCHTIFISYGLLGIIVEKIIKEDSKTEDITDEIYEIINANMKIYAE